MGRREGLCIFWGTLVGWRVCLSVIGIDVRSIGIVYLVSRRVSVCTKVSCLSI